METPQGGAGGGQGEAAAAAGGSSSEPPRSPPPLSPTSAAAVALLNARWCPTKEQVAVLEGLYDRGLCTPTAEQIQHITSQLQEHGPIEAKNVFYWFQNHKARLRQRQRQDSFAYFTRLLRRPPPLPLIAGPPGSGQQQTSYPTLGRMPPPAASPPPPPPLVMTMGPPQIPRNNNAVVGGSHRVVYRAPYYMPAPPQHQASSGHAAGCYNYNLQQQAAAHHMAVMYSRSEMAQQRQMNPAMMYSYGMGGSALQASVPPANAGGGASASRVVGRRSRETLELFPLQPTFLQAENARGNVLTSASTPSAPASSSFPGGEFENPVVVEEGPDSNAEELPFYDFLGLQSAGR